MLDVEQQCSVVLRCLAVVFSGKVGGDMMCSVGRNIPVGCLSRSPRVDVQGGGVVYQAGLSFSCSREKGWLNDVDKKKSVGQIFRVSTRR